MQAADNEGLGKSNDFKYLEDNLQAQKEHFESLQKQGILDPQGEKDLEQLNYLDKLEQAGRTLLKAASDCVTKYG